MLCLDVAVNLKDTKTISSSVFNITKSLDCFFFLLDVFFNETYLHISEKLMGFFNRKEIITTIEKKTALKLIQL